MRGLFDKKAKRMPETAFGGNDSLIAIRIFEHFANVGILCEIACKRRRGTETTVRELKLGKAE